MLAPARACCARQSAVASTASRRRQSSITPLATRRPVAPLSLSVSASTSRAAQRRLVASAPSASLSPSSSASNNSNSQNNSHPTRDAYMQLARVHNVLPSVLLTLVGASAAARSVRLALLAPSVWAAAGCSCGVAVASMAVNDYFDRAVDRRNRPDKPIPSGRVPPDGAVLFAACAYVAALATACLLEPPALRAVVALSSTVTMLYTPLFKRVPLVKNLTVAAVVALAPLAGALAVCGAGGGGGGLGGGSIIQSGIGSTVSSGAGHQWLTAAGADAVRRLGPCSAFAFFGVAYREVLMDVHDLEGDLAEGVVTAPALLGRGGALAAALLLLAVGTVGALRLLYGGGLLIELPAATASAFGVFTGPVVALMAAGPALALLALSARCAQLALGAARGGWLPERVDDAVNECLKPLGAGIVLLAAVAAVGA